MGGLGEDLEEGSVGGRAEEGTEEGQEVAVMGEGWEEDLGGAETVGD